MIMKGSMLAGAVRRSMRQGSSAQIIYRLQSSRAVRSGSNATILPSLAAHRFELDRRVRDASKSNSGRLHLSAKAFADPSSADLLVIGCGIAGSATALQAAKHGMRVIMLTSATDPIDCNSYWAQGGIIYKSNDDSPDLLAKDVHAAGAGLCDHPAVMKLAVDGPTRVEDMLLGTANVPFDRNELGKLSLTLEASHSRARIIHWKDQTGVAITTSIQRAAASHPRITILKGTTAVDLALAFGNGGGVRCVGAHVISGADGALRTIHAPATMLATGGLGEIYEYTSNPPSARGDGFALALRAGAAMRNMEFVQFHPTTLQLPGQRAFLLTEALRGEGAALIDSSGRRFAFDYHPAGELAPRDVVARAIVLEMRKQGAKCMYLDADGARKGPEWVRNRFPGVAAHCASQGLDLGSQPLPVVPAAHYFCGGVDTDLLGRTTVPGLMAAGEVACTGLHGANRLASTSLLEGLVWGCQAADHLASAQSGGKSELAALEDAAAVATPLAPRTHGSAMFDSVAAAAAWRRLKEVMWQDVGVVRTPEGLRKAMKDTAEIARSAEMAYLSSPPTAESAALRNAADTASLVAEAAAANPVSTGCHYIEGAEEMAEEELRIA